MNLYKCFPTVTPNNYAGYRKFFESMLEGSLRLPSLSLKDDIIYY